MSFETDNLQLEDLYLNKVKKTQLDESLSTNLKAVGIGAILSILSALTSYHAGSGVARHVQTSSEVSRDTREGVNHIIQMSQDIIDCMNKRASDIQPVSQGEIQKLRDLQFLYSDLKSNTQNISKQDVDHTLEKLKDVIYASNLEDEPRLHRWINVPVYQDPHNLH